MELLDLSTYACLKLHDQIQFFALRMFPIYVVQRHGGLDRAWLRVRFSGLGRMVGCRKGERSRIRTHDGRSVMNGPPEFEVVKSGMEFKLAEFV